MFRIFILATLTFFQGNIVISGDLSSLVNNYETLQITELDYRVSRRNTASKQATDKEILFRTLGRNFHLSLHVNSKVFAPDFKAFVVNGKGEETEVDINKDTIYRGVVEGDDDSFVHAQIEDGGVLTAKISTKEDVYYVEPSWRHTNDSHSTDMICYRHSDIKFNLTHGGSHSLAGHASFCASKEVFKGNVSMENAETTSQSRRRRAITKNTCSLAVVADNQFYKEMGQSNYAKTVNYMAGVIDRVDKIYRSTVWRDGYANYGFEIRQIKVHIEEGGARYNSNIKWQIKSLLEAFSKEDWTDVCLAHLFTYRDFDNGVIGLAYVGNSEISAMGGICSRVYRRGSETLYLNCGLSSNVNWGRKLLTEEADIVTAHELGHNFGAEHDPDNDECAPSDQDGGKYIMYPASVDGNKKNNQKFSSCSKTSIFKTLRAKSDYCFSEPKGQFCGNFKVEGDEECDPGNQGYDKCCTSKCTLQLGKHCSDLNDPCCHNCTFAPSTEVCRGAQPFQCRAKAYCDGTSKNCPNSPLADDDTRCVGLGLCRSGKCLTFCEQYKMTPCVCELQSDSCKLCCQNETTTCKPYRFTNGSIIPLDNGELCPIGVCVHGTCTKISQDPIERFWSVIRDVDINALAEFMKDNIVGTIVIFSLLFWIPLSCIVHRIDLKHDKEEDELFKWYDPRNTQLIRRSKRVLGNIFKPQDQSDNKKSQQDKSQTEVTSRPYKPKPLRHQPQPATQRV